MKTLIFNSRESLNEWLIDHDDYRLVATQLNGNTIVALVKHRDEDDED